MTEEYTPISCELHSKFELWTMHCQRLRIAWHDINGGSHIGVVMPKDVKTESGSEYLCFTDITDDKAHRIRLDYIIRAEVFA